MSIEVKDVTYTYNPGTTFAKTALKEVSLMIPDGDFVGLIGHTGSGKSTLIQTLNGLIVPTAGQVLVDGEDIHRDKSKLTALRQKVGLVFQYPEHQLFEMTIYKDVAYGPKNQNLSEAEVDARVREALMVVGIEDALYEKSPFELSGGQKRRVAIAGVLAMAPKVLILDEPTAGLDPKGRDDILNVVKNMHKKLGITVILVSHSMEDVAKTVEHIVVMDHGKVAMMGTPQEIFAQSGRLEAMGLAAPQINYVFASLKEKGYSVPTDIFTVEAAAKALLEFCKG